MPVFTDQTGRLVQINSEPLRIVSLVPSQTELLFSLNLQNRIIGITRYCIHPAEQCSRVECIGGTKNPDLQKIIGLKPDLIIANKEENRKKDIDFLEKKSNVWVTDIENLDQALQMISDLGNITGQVNRANEIIQKIQAAFLQLKVSPNPVKVLYAIWKKPLMVAGNRTFINDMLTKAGYDNLMQNSSQRYPQINQDLVKILKPHVILLSTEPYSFTQEDVKEFEHIFPDSKVCQANGEFFSWYGSRLTEAPSYFNELRNEINSLISS